MVDDDTVRGEDDFRKIDPDTKDANKPHRLRGTNLTRYSMYGKFCADYRGYGNGNAALREMGNSLGGNAYPFRVSTGMLWWMMILSELRIIFGKLIRTQKMPISHIDFVEQI